MAELIIGEHCSVSSCKQLDFLPCMCNRCGKAFCKIHAFYEAHDCPVRVRDVDCINTDEHEDRTFACDLDSCSTHELVEVRCDLCERNFCLKHRLPADHACVGITEKPERMAKTARHVEAILAENQVANAGIKKAQKLTERSKAMNSKLQLMKLKQCAIGDKSISDSDRVYFELNLPSNDSNCSQTSDPSKKSIAMFFSKHWTVGKIIDYAAAAKGLVNKNNILNADKLCLCDDAARLLPNALQIENLLTKEKEDLSSEKQEDKGDLNLYNGSRLFLRYFTVDGVPL